MSAQQTPVSLRAHSAEILAGFFEDGVDIQVRLTGFSMKPLVRSGSVLRFSAGLAPRVGDIVLMRFPDGQTDKLVAHRVLALDDDHVWTKGDSSRAPDAPMPHARVLASATALETRVLSIPLTNAPMRALGLVSSSLYPHLVRAYRTIVPRKDALSCAN